MKMFDQEFLMIELSGPTMNDQAAGDGDIGIKIRFFRLDKNFMNNL